MTTNAVPMTRVAVCLTFSQRQVKYYFLPIAQRLRPNITVKVTNICVKNRGAHPNSRV